MNSWRLARGLLVVMLLAASPAVFAQQPCCGPITADGMKLAHLLDNSGVDHLWLAAQQIVWNTGQQDPDRPGGARRSTHCSAFAAAMAQRTGVYLLRPPEHGQDLLANAQLRWLAGDAGQSAGWRPMATPIDAQEAANRGELVLAVYENPDPHRPGHIVVLRPSAKTTAELESDGPEEAQAGAHNWTSGSVADGFRHHHGAWQPGGTGGIRFFAHAVDWTAAG